MLVLDTDHGPAHAHIHDVVDPRGVLVLGHGAGGGVGARDIVETKDAALSVGIAVALVEQPYRVAGRRSPPPGWQLDVAWMTVVDGLRAGWFRELPLVAGGRSPGADGGGSGTGASVILGPFERRRHPAQRRGVWLST